MATLIQPGRIKAPPDFTYRIGHEYTCTHCQARWRIDERDPFSPLDPHDDSQGVAVMCGICHTMNTVTPVGPPLEIR